jgi:hypothetical protein
MEYTASFWQGLIMFSLEVACWISIGLLARDVWLKQSVKKAA